MTIEERDRQQNCGIQRMLIRTILYESRYSFIGYRSDKLQEWSGLTKQEFDRLENLARQYSPFSMSDTASDQYVLNISDGDDWNRKCYFGRIMRRNGFAYIQNKLFDGTYDFSKEASDSAKYASSGLVLDDEDKSYERFLEVMEFYYDFFMRSVCSLLEDGYDWLVIKELLETDDDSIIALSGKIKAYMPQAVDFSVPLKQYEPGEKALLYREVVLKQIIRKIVLKENGDDIIEFCRKQYGTTKENAEAMLGFATRSFSYNDLSSYVESFAEGIVSTANSYHISESVIKSRIQKILNIDEKDAASFYRVVLEKN